MRRRRRAADAKSLALIQIGRGGRGSQSFFFPAFLAAVLTFLPFAFAFVLVLTWAFGATTSARSVERGGSVWSTFRNFRVVCTENSIRIDSVTELPYRQRRWSRCYASCLRCSPRRSSRRADLRRRTQRSGISWLCCGGRCAVASNSRMAIGGSSSSCIDGFRRS